MNEVVNNKLSPSQTGEVLWATGAEKSHSPHIFLHDVPVHKLKQPVVLLKINNPKAGFEILFFSLSVILGKRTPFSEEDTSSIAEESAVAPVVLMAAPF